MMRHVWEPSLEPTNSTIKLNLLQDFEVDFVTYRPFVVHLFAVVVRFLMFLFVYVLSRVMSCIVMQRHASRDTHRRTWEGREGEEATRRTVAPTTTLTRRRRQGEGSTAATSDLTRPRTAPLTTPVVR